jgi:hypothetical protein
LDSLLREFYYDTYPTGVRQCNCDYEGYDRRPPDGLQAFEEGLLTEFDAMLDADTDEAVGASSSSRMQQGETFAQSDQRRRLVTESDEILARQREYFVHEAGYRFGKSYGSVAADRAADIGSCPAITAGLGGKAEEASAKQLETSAEAEEARKVCEAKWWTFRTYKATQEVAVESSSAGIPSFLREEDSPDEENAGNIPPDMEEADSTQRNGYSSSQPGAYGESGYSPVGKKRKCGDKGKDVESDDGKSVVVGGGDLKNEVKSGLKGVKSKEEISSSYQWLRGGGMMQAGWRTVGSFFEVGSNFVRSDGKRSKLLQESSEPRMFEIVFERARVNEFAWRSGYEPVVDEKARELKREKEEHEEMMRAKVKMLRSDPICLDWKFVVKTGMNAVRGLDRRCIGVTKGSEATGCV